MRDKAAPDSTRLTLVVIAGVTLVTYAAALTDRLYRRRFLHPGANKGRQRATAPASYFRTGFFEYYRPVAFLSHALDWTLWGAEPFGFHLTNVLLHAATTLLVWVLGRRLLDGAAPVIAALLFALHPASHEAVYWIAARFDLLATFFTLLALWCLSGRCDGFAHRRIWAAFGMALLSKESAISLLVVAPAWDVWIERRDWRTTARRLLPLLLVAAAYLAIRSLGTDVAVTGGAETPRQGGSARAGARGGACGGVATRQRGYSPGAIGCARSADAQQC
jgi:hypothetical protein